MSVSQRQRSKSQNEHKQYIVYSQERSRQDEGISQYNFAQSPQGAFSSHVASSLPAAQLCCARPIYQVYGINYNTATTSYYSGCLCLLRPVSTRQNTLDYDRVRLESRGHFKKGQTESTICMSQPKGWVEIIQINSILKLTARIVLHLLQCI